MTIMHKLNNLLRSTVNRSALFDFACGVHKVDIPHQCLYHCFNCGKGTLSLTTGTVQQVSTLSSQPLYSLQTATDLKELLNRHLMINNLVPIQTRAVSRTSKNRKLNKRRVKDEDSDSDETDSDDEDSDEEEEEELFANDADAPLVYSEMTINTMRADRVAAKGLKMTTSEVVDMFYGSKFLRNGKPLTRKAVKLHANDKLDLIITEQPGKLSVKRVKVLSVEDDKKAATGTGKTKIRVWRLPFDIKTPPGWKI